MATALSNIRPLAWVGSRTGAPANIKIKPEGTSESFSAGHLVIMDRSENGLVALANTSGVPTAATFYGIALEDASTTAGSQIAVLLPTPDDLFVASLATAEDTFVAPDVDNVGGPYGIVLMDSDNSTVFAVDEAQTNWVIVEEIYGPDITKRSGSVSGSYPTMSTGDRVVFRFLNSTLDSSGSQA